MFQDKRSDKQKHDIDIHQHPTTEKEKEKEKDYLVFPPSLLLVQLVHC